VRSPRAVPRSVSCGRNCATCRSSLAPREYELVAAERIPAAPALVELLKLTLLCFRSIIAFTQASAPQALKVAGLFNRETRSLPFGIPVFQARGLEAALAQLSHGLVRQNTVRATAVGDDFLTARQFAQPAFEFGKRQVYRA
jgi:hypothetical protein